MAKYMIQLSPELERTVKQLAEQQSIGATEVIERAIALYKYVSEQQNEDKTVAILSNTGELDMKLTV